MRRNDQQFSIKFYISDIKGYHHLLNQETNVFPSHWCFDGFRIESEKYIKRILLTKVTICYFLYFLDWFMLHYQITNIENAFIKFIWKLFRIILSGEIYQPFIINLKLLLKIDLNLYNFFFMLDNFILNRQGKHNTLMVRFLVDVMGCTIIVWWQQIMFSINRFYNFLSKGVRLKFAIWLI